MKKYIYECEECGFKFIAFDDKEDTVHENFTGHKKFKNLGEVRPATPIYFIKEGSIFIEIPWEPENIANR